jgi:hypothetical protein
MPGGFLVLHVADAWKYGPVTTLKGIKYTSKLYPKKHREIITYQQKKIQRDTPIYMESVSNILTMALNTGFTVHSMYAYKLPYEHQYMYVFIKSE